MKKLLLATVISSLLLLSCREEPKSYHETLSGTWQLDRNELIAEDLSDTIITESGIEYRLYENGSGVAFYGIPIDYNDSASLNWSVNEITSTFILDFTGPANDPDTFHITSIFDNEFNLHTQWFNTGENRMYDQYMRFYKMQ